MCVALGGGKKINGDAYSWYRYEGGWKLLLSFWASSWLLPRSSDRKRQWCCPMALLQESTNSGLAKKHLASSISNRDPACSLSFCLPAAPCNPEADKSSLHWLGRVFCLRFEHISFLRGEKKIPFLIYDKKKEIHHKNMHIERSKRHSRNATSSFQAGWAVGLG